MSDDALRRRLCDLGEFLRDTVIEARDGDIDMADVVDQTEADTIFAIDKATDDVLVAWFERNWRDVRIVSEGLHEPVDVGTPAHTVIVDPIDGTRGLMYDKRSAWALAAVAPTGGTLADVTAAAMVEIPTTRQWSSDLLSAVVGVGVVSARVDVRAGRRSALSARPSTATTLDQGWASFAKFFPPAKSLIAQFEERVWVELYGSVPPDLAIFDDQYVSTGGQIAELTLGRDRMLGDVRPLAFAELGMDSSIACHPYDICTARVLTEAGGVVLDPWGRPLDAPLDTTTPVAWVGYANQRLADWIAPAIDRAVRATFPRAYA